ncbi:WXG100 family type VII secretion target [Nocardia carnea]|uniref:WXG100 family type VII secretion target n=1 Tax=Nocardia carnea TaxID=37328 RepID=UPI00245586A3|nr:hypothetical protein [Nocardia carnea]
MRQLIEDLKGLRSELRIQAADLETAAGELSAAWEGNAGFDGFRAAKSRFDAEFGRADIADSTVDETTIGTLNGLGRAVETAWENAMNIDARVSNSFGG